MQSGVIGASLYRMFFKTAHSFFNLSVFLLVFAGCLITGCRSNSYAEISGLSEQRGFYFWKTHFDLKSSEQAALNALKVGQLYVRFFDVAISEEQQQAIPVGIIRISDSFPKAVKVTPVIFITTEVLRSESFSPDTLAFNISRLLQRIRSQHSYPESGFVQIDCDWTQQTRKPYFDLLEALKKTTFFQQQKLSVTIRLHQLKYREESGIPPAERGLLMCYNMGNLRDIKAKNSIVDPAVFKQYMGRAESYPLSLDIALPLFDWWVWYKRESYFGLIHAGNLPPAFEKEGPTLFSADTTVQGYRFEKGDMLRYESSTVADLQAVLSGLPESMRSQKNQLLLYHLDSACLSKYTTHELENLYRRFH